MADADTAAIVEMVVEGATVGEVKAEGVGVVAVVAGAVPRRSSRPITEVEVIMAIATKVAAVPAATARYNRWQTTKPTRASLTSFSNSTT